MSVTYHVSQEGQQPTRCIGVTKHYFDPSEHFAMRPTVFLEGGARIGTSAT